MPNDQTPAGPEPFPREPIPPELKEWAIRTFDMEVFLAGIKEIQEGGGKTLDEFIGDLEKEVLGDKGGS